MSELYITIPLGILNDEPNLAKVAISLPELVTQTNAFSVKRRPGCTPSLKGSNPQELFLHYNVKCHESYSDPTGHDVKIKFDVEKVEETQMAKDLDVQVNCSCPAFLYWGAQWNLHSRDGLYGEPRPKLIPPTERLDLRGNFVICKHVKAVFERILPSVQHNIIKILRERALQRNKEKVRETPERLNKEQERMRKRKEVEKLRKVKNKDIQQKLLDALREQEEQKLLKQVEHEEDLLNSEQGEEPGVVEREQPATGQIPEVKTPVAPPHQYDEHEDIKQLEEGEEQRLREEEHKKLKHQPHLHKGLPYETDEQQQEHGHDTPSDYELLKKLKEKETKPNQMKDFTDKRYKTKRTSLEKELLASLVGDSDENRN